MPRQARSTDPSSSHLAAASMEHIRAAQQTQIMRALTDGPASKSVIASMTGLTGEAVCRRLPELYEIGRAEPTDKLVKSSSGRAERVWRVRV